MGKITLYAVTCAILMALSFPVGAKAQSYLTIGEVYDFDIGNEFQSKNNPNPLPPNGYRTTTYMDDLHMNLPPGPGIINNGGGSLNHGRCNSDTSLQYFVCDSISINGITYTSSGTYIQTIPNVAGCDSVITLFLTINYSVYYSTTHAQCGGFYTYYPPNYGWGVLPVLLNSSGTYVFENQYYIVCKWVDTVHLSINSPSHFNLDTIACGEIFLNGDTFSIPGTYFQTLPNHAGCDSIITINYLLENVDTSVVQNNYVLKANATPATYQWIDCDNSTNPILTGETFQEFSAPYNGNFAVMVTQNGCTRPSACYEITGLGIEKPTSGIQLSIYPNPFTGQITLSSDLGIEGSMVKILGLGGKIIFETKPTGHIYSIDLGGLPPALYILEFWQDEKVERHKLLKL